jgi:hypothetical protein
MLTTNWCWNSLGGRACQAKDRGTHDKCCRPPGKELEVTINLKTMKGDMGYDKGAKIIGEEQTGNILRLGTRFALLVSDLSRSSLWGQMRTSDEVHDAVL